MEERSLKSMWKTVLIVVAAVVGMILYVFVSSAIAGRNDSGKTADMYGVDSLEYVAEPVMKIYVWQRNEKTKADNPDGNLRSDFFYNLVPLDLKVGNSVRTVCEIEREYSFNHAVFNVEYDGTLTGEYEIQWEGSVIYCERSDIFPNDWFVETKNAAFSYPDASFRCDGDMTLNIVDVGTDMLRNQRTKSYDRSQLIEERKYWDYASEQSIYEAYPDAPKSLGQAYRLVITADLTIRAMHERKTDVPIATAVLEIRHYSRWIAPDAETYRKLKEYCADINYADITVKSYTQTTRWD